MTDSIDHASLSELLPAYVRGELGQDAAGAVAAHLEACSECRLEHAGLVALVEAEPDPLTDEERAALRAAVADKARPAVVAPLARARPGRRAWALGVAASVALLVAGVGLVGSLELGGGRDDEAAVGAPAQADRDAEGAGEAPESKREAKARALEQDAVTAEDTGEAGTATAAGVAGRPQPVFDSSAGTLTRAGLRRLGRRAEPFSAFAQAYGVRDARRLHDDYLSALAAAAPDRRGRAQVRRCAAMVFGTNPDAILPAYGALGERDGRPSLVLGFAWSERDEGRLFRYMFWIWPRESCDAPAYQAGKIKR